MDLYTKLNKSKAFYDKYQGPQEAYDLYTKRPPPLYDLTKSLEENRRMYAAQNPIEKQKAPAPVEGNMGSGIGQRGMMNY